MSPSDSVLVEVKVTRKYLADLPKGPAGLFFGMTENEEMSLKVFGSNAVLCLSSIDPGPERYFTADWYTFQTLNMNKRTQ